MWFFFIHSTWGFIIKYWKCGLRFLWRISGNDSWNIYHLGCLDSRKPMRCSLTSTYCLGTGLLWQARSLRNTPHWCMRWRKILILSSKELGNIHKGQCKQLYFIVTYFNSVSDRLLVPSFDYIYFIGFSVEEQPVREIMWNGSVEIL